MHLIRHGAQSGAHVLPHQAGLLMLKDVAMIHERVIARCRLIESDEKLRFVLNKHHVLPAREMRRRRRSRGGQDAEQCTVDMKRVCHSSRDYLPDLVGSEAGLDIDAFHVERFSIYPCEGDLGNASIDLLRVLPDPAKYFRNFAQRPASK